MSPFTTKTTAGLVAASILITVMAAGTACSAAPSPKVTAPAVPTSMTTPAGAPVAPPTPATTPLPSATWPPKMPPPTPPAEMSRDDETGAIAAAKYFLLELYPYVELTQDAAAWRAMSHADCNFCHSVLATVATKQAEGTVTAVAPMTVHSTEVHEVNPLMFTVTLDIDTGPDEDFNQDGLSLGQTTKVSGTAIIIVVRRGTEWVTRGVDLKPRS